MKAAILEPDSAVLTVEDIPVPTPGPGEVLVKVHACGVCHTDLHVIKGEINFPRPGVLGHEISGTVAEVGPGVEGLEPGTSVVSSFIMPCGRCRRCARGEDELCLPFFEMNRKQGVLYDGTTRLHRADGSDLAMYSMGGLAEYSVVPATDVFAVPPETPLSDAAIIGCSLFTAFGATHNVAALELGQSVAVVAVGGVGLNVVQLAHLSGAHPIVAVDVADDKLEAAQQLGATHLVNSRSVDPREEVTRITGGRGVDVAFEVLGRTETVELAVGLLGEGGRAVLVGIPPLKTTASLELTDFVRRKLSVQGSYGARTRSDMPTLVELVTAGSVQLQGVVSRRYPIDEAPQAYQDLDAGGIVGRAVVEMPAAG